MADWAPLPPLPWLPYAPLAGAALLAARAADIGRRFGSTARHGLLAPPVTEADVAAQRDGLHAHGALPGRAYTADDFGRRGEREQRHRVLLLEALALVEVLVWTFVASMQYASSEVDAASAPAVSAAATWLVCLLVLIARPPTTPPLLLGLVLLLRLLVPLNALLSSIPLLLEGHFDARANLPFIADALVTLTALGLIGAMPVAPGGWEGQVPAEERRRILEGKPIAEMADIKASYELCPTTPEDYTSLLASLTYSWMGPMQKLALKRPLVPTDVWRLRAVNDVDLLSQAFSAHRGPASRPRLGRALLRANARNICQDAAFKLTSVSLAYAGPVFMRRILEALSAEDTSRPGEWGPRSYALSYAVATLVFTGLRYVTEVRSYHCARQVGLRIRICLVNELFVKALKRRDVSGVAVAAETQKASESMPLLAEAKKPKGSAAKQDQKEDSADVGKLVNILSSDINVLLRAGCDAHQLYGAPMEAVLAMVLLYRLLGWASLAGVVLLIAALPVNWLISRVAVRVQRKWRTATDRRVALVAELLTAIRFVKQQGIESRWCDRVLAAREKELAALIVVRITELGFVALWLVTPILVTLCSLYVYTSVQSQVLTVPVAFTAVTLFAMLRSPLNVIPAFLMVALNSLVSLRRLEAFLTEEEVDDAVSSLKAHDAAGSGVRSAIASEESDDHELPLGFEGPARFMWNQASSSRGSATPQFCLEVPSIDFPPGALTVVTGRIAAGKSMLLHALLGELRCSSGTLRLPKFSGGVSRISFAGQTPWLQAGKSIRDNICFVTDYDAARYRLIVDACALRLDIDALEDGDDTQIARDTLSGGQRARVCLARALYARSHTVILDDVLSAVDAKVQQHLVQHALLAKEVTGGRRIIIATHHPKLLEEHAAMMLTLHDGKVVNVARQAAPLEVASSLGTDAGPSTSASSAGSTASDGLKDAAARPAPQEDAVQPKSARLLYQLEGRRQGAVAWGLFSVYARASSSVPWLAILLLTILFRVAIGSEQGWLKWWGEASRQHVPKRVVSWLPSLPPAEGHERFYLLGYAVIGIAMIVLVLIKQLVFYFATLAASRRLFRTLFTNLVRAPMSWYDANPLGRVIQRLGADFSVVDTDLPGSSLMLFNDLWALATYLLLCALIVPWFLLPSALLLAFGPRYVRGFLAATRDMQRIESTSSSPMYQAFSQALQGVVTLRAFGAEAQAAAHMRDITSTTMALWWAIATSDVWCSFRSQILGGVSVFLATVLAITGTVSPGSAGIVMSSATLITQICLYLTVNWKNLSNNMNSMERVIEYMDVESEIKAEHDREPPAAWPSRQATIAVEGLSMRYRPELPEVLRDVSFHINAHEKVGIVGRTGSGKSSLFTSAFFRMAPLSAGRVIIDGLDIATLPLETLRQRLAIVPQDPTLFGGTIRDNLDPWAEHSDEALLHALARVQVRATHSIADRQGSAASEQEGSVIALDTPVAPGGANFSAGQAQLLALARALLRDAQIVLLDEATSNTDHQTDQAIQRTIRAEMQQSIVITIAHRLESVVDYDRILVMDAGRCVEFDMPAALLSKEGGAFRTMCQAAGPAAFASLCRGAGLLRE